MYSDLTLRIEHVDGEVSELVVPSPVAIEDDEAVTLSTIMTEEALDRVDRAEASVFRDEWTEVQANLDRRNDDLFIEDADSEEIFGGKLDDWQFGGSLVSVQIDSFERVALDAEPPASFEIENDTDEMVARAIIDEMPDPLNAGFIDETVSSIDYEATHTSPGEMLRDLARSTGADVRYRPDGTIDYLKERGSKSDETVELSTGTIIEEPRIRETLREEVTDVRVVSEDDPELYEEATAIETSDDERRVWATDEMDSTSSSRLQARATRLANEYAEEPEYLEIETTLDPVILGETPKPGDRYDVELPAYDIDAELRVIEADRTIDSDGERVEVLLSNRKLTLSGR